MSGIRLSDKHGVNPAIPVCFWCGGTKNEIVMFGKLPGDKEAPRNVIMDYEPCDKCKAQFDQGVLLIEGSSKPKHENQLEIIPNVYPTGRIMVMKTDAAERVFRTYFPEQADVILSKKKAILETEAFEWLMPEEPKEGDKNDSNGSEEQGTPGEV